MSFIRPVLSLLLFLQGWTYAWAQYNQTETYTYSDGLAMTECGLVFCDRSGKIWTHHATGWVSRYDGITFTRYSPAEIGNYSDGGQMVEDRYGIWLLKNGTISLFKNESWKSWHLPKLFNVIVDPASQQAVILDAQNQLWSFDSIKLEWNIYSQLPERTPGAEYLLIPSRVNNQILLLHAFPNDHNKPARTFTSPSLRHPVWTEDPSLLPLGPEWAFENFYTKTYHHYTQSLLRTTVLDTFQYVTFSKNLLLGVRLLSGNSSDDFTFLVYSIDPQGNTQLLSTFRSGHEHASVAMDHMGNVWSGSHNGLSRIQTNILQCHDDVPHMVSNIHVINEDYQGRIWFGGYTTGSCYFENGTIHPVTPDAERFKSFLPGSYRNANGDMAFWTEDYWLVTNTAGTWDYTHKNPGLDGRMVGYYFLPLSQNRVAAGLQGFGFGITAQPVSVTSEWTLIGKEKGMLLDNVLTLAEDQRNRIWVGRTNQGVAVYDPVIDTAQTWLAEQDSLMPFGMLSSVIDQDGRLWMGCSDGLRVIESPHTFKLFSDDIHASVRKITMEEAGYSHVAFLKIYDHFLVFGNQDGYGFVDLNSFKQNPDRPRIFFYETDHFGQSAEQNAILLDSKGYLWLGLDKGATRLDMKGFILDSVPITLTAKHIVIKEQNDKESRFTFNEDGEVRLPVNKRSIQVAIASSFSGWLNDNVGLQYRLLHDRIADTLWSPYTRDFNIKLDYLPPGKNTLQIRAIKNNQIAFQKAYVIILPRTLFENALFWVLVFGLVSMVGLLVTRRIYRQRLHLKLAQINIAEQQREKNQFQISAIANSLNPHFIKNTLMWMQSRFRKDEQVTDVIDRLSYNISTVFAQSRKGEAFHTLNEEMKVTENFLAIQVATYGNFLTIDFPDPQTWQPWKNYIVPLLQFQIHVENAIEHGLRSKANGPRILSLAFREEAHYIQASITDNGIGRIAASERGSRGSHQGTSMLHRIYELFNQQNEFHFSTDYEDLYDPVTGEAMGTKVIITIPKRYNTQLA